MRHTLASVYIIWYREILRYLRDRSRIVGSLVFPIIFLFIFGSGLSPSLSGLTSGLGLPTTGPGAINFTKFIFPGVIGMNVVMASIMSGVSIVWDREFGFLKEVLVAPVSRSAVAIGKTLGGSTVAVFQGLLILIFAPLIGVSLSAILILELIPFMLLAAIALTSMGVSIAARMRSMEGFQMIMQFVTFPMIFLSGALFPARNLPAWMNFLVKVNPVSYAVDPLRQLVLRSQNLPPEVLKLLPQAGLTLEVLGHPMTIGQDAIVVGGFGVLMVALAVWMFNRQD